MMASMRTHRGTTASSDVRWHCVMSEILSCFPSPLCPKQRDNFFLFFHWGGGSLATCVCACPYLLQTAQYPTPPAHCRDHLQVSVIHLTQMETALLVVELTGRTKSPSGLTLTSWKLQQTLIISTSLYRQLPLYPGCL